MIHHTQQEIREEDEETMSREEEQIKKRELCDAQKKIIITKKHVLNMLTFGEI